MARKRRSHRSLLSQLADLASWQVLSESTRLELEKLATENAKRDMRDPEFRKRMSEAFQSAWRRQSARLRSESRPRRPAERP